MILFIFDTYKSPKIEVKITLKINKILVDKLISKIVLKINKLINPHIAPAEIDPIYPSKVLFGEILLINPIFVFPKILPDKYPKISIMKIRDKI